VTLEDLIRETHRQGRLADLSVHRAGRGFQANYMHTAGNGHRVMIADDPVTALIAVLTPAPVNEPDDIGDMLS
jgi:hypothetical protein